MSPPTDAAEQSPEVAGQRDDDPSGRPTVSPLGRLCIGLVRLYQWTLSPLIGNQCRYRPTCSHYMIGVIERYGAIRGVPKGLLRILRCNPFGGSGYDPP